MPIKIKVAEAASPQSFRQAVSVDVIISVTQRTQFVMTKRWYSIIIFRKYLKATHTSSAALKIVVESRF